MKTFVKNTAKNSLILSLALISLFPFVAGAQTNTNFGDPAVSGGAKPTDANFQLVACNPKLGANGQLTNECNYEALIQTVKNIIQFVLYLLIPIVTGMILYVGFKYLTAGGDVGKVADAKRMVMPIMIGLFCIFGAWLMVYTLLDYLLKDSATIIKSNIIPSSLLNKTGSSK